MIYDFIIIGGGAVGFFAAISAKERDRNLRVLILEKTFQPLAKVRISGGGRCNVTHACFEPKELVENYPRGKLELLGPFSRFHPAHTVEWFERRGVQLKVEKDGRMFPVSDTSMTIIDCFMKECDRLGIEIRLGYSVEHLDVGFKINGELEASSVLLATGSSKKGWELAKRLGHTVVDPVPSLFSFNCPTSPLLDLPGIAVERARASLAGTQLETEGPLLTTHWGFSGPAILKLSAFGARLLYDQQYRMPLIIDWGEGPLAKNLLKRLDLSHPSVYQIEGKTPFKYEFVTAGGILLKEVNFKTFESRLIPRLFFAGEILDIDGVTGGFNFQNAWTGAYLSSQALMS